MHRVFVYGTLKKGYHNHHHLKNCKFEEAEALGFTLHASAYLPYVIQGEGIVYGELYEVDDEILRRLDYLEGHPKFYKRIETPIKVADRIVPAWIYIYHRAKEHPLIESGLWLGKQNQPNN